MKLSKIFLPIILIFIVLNGFFIIFRKLLEENGFDQEVLIISNVILFTVTIAGMFLQRRGLKSTNPHAFVRSVYVAMIVKLLFCLIAAVVYITSVGGNVNKPALFVSMGLYMVYTALEVAALMKSAGKKNG